MNDSVKTFDKAKLHIFGARGSRSLSGVEYLEFGGLTSCYIIKMEEYALIIDVGTGLEQAKTFLSDCKKIDILLTHFHSDHILGILNPGTFPADAKFRFFAEEPPGKTIQAVLDTFVAPPFWAGSISFDHFEFFPVQPGDRIDLGNGCRVEAHSSNHVDLATIYRINAPWGSVCAIFDYEHGKHDLRDFVRNCDLMIYDGMYSPEEYEKFKGWGHSTWEEGAKLAIEAGVKQLLITHHSPVKTDEELKAEEAKAVGMFANLRFARAGEEVDFPL